MTLAPDYRKSVTARDYADDPRSGVGRFHILMPVGRYGGEQLGDTLALPYELTDRPWTRETDRIFRRATRYESLWACAMTASIAQDVGVDFEISGGPIKKAHWKNLLNFAGHGWKSHLLPRLKKDFQQTNNGMFIELERASRSSASRITNIHWLDSLYCERTGDPDFPVIYTDARGYEHVMPAHTIQFAAMNPSSEREDLGRGECSTQMSWRQICKLAAIERLIYEKVSGKGVDSIQVILGMDDRTLEDVIDSSKLNAQQKDAEEGRIFARQHLGTILVGMLRDDVKHISIPLKGFPEGFDAQMERGWALNTYANAAGIDPQVLAPLVGGELGGTSRQSETLKAYRDQRAGVLFEQTFTHLLNDWIIPQDTTLFFVSQDLQARKAEAEVKQLETTNILSVHERGLLTDPQAQAMLADQDIIAKEYVMEEQRPMDGLSEHEKQLEVDNATPQTETNGTNAQNQNQQVAASIINSTQSRTVAKATDDELDSMIDRELADALTWVKAIQKTE